MSVFPQLCANSFLSIPVCDHCVWHFRNTCFCAGYNCGGVRMGGANCLDPVGPYPLLYTLIHTTKNTQIHSLSLCSPRGVITVPIIIHASQGCSHADCHLDTHKHSNSYKPQLHFKPIDQGQIHELKCTENSSCFLFPSRKGMQEALLFFFCLSEGWFNINLELHFLTVKERFSAQQLKVKCTTA